MIKLTEKINFIEKAEDAFRFIEKQGTVLDVDLMVELGFTPPAWKVWKPSLIQKLTNVILPKEDREKEDWVRVKITYDKKKKSWNAIEFIP